MSRKEPHPLDVALGVRIRERRRTLGVSLDELGEAAGLSFQQIHKYECGESCISVSRLIAIAARLECRRAELTDGLEGPEAPSKPEARLLRLLSADGARELLQCSADLPRGHQRVVIHHVRGLAARGRRSG